MVCEGPSDRRFCAGLDSTSMAYVLGMLRHHCLVLWQALVLTRRPSSGDMR